VFDIQTSERVLHLHNHLRLRDGRSREAQDQVVVLDRPNPINGMTSKARSQIENLQNSRRSIHLLSPGAGALWNDHRRAGDAVHSERKIGADHGDQDGGWRRADFFDGTALTWVNPSPNMRSLIEALLYPGIGLLETTNISVGRGTDTPFEIIGAPWMDGQKLAEALNRAGLAGVRFVPVRFTPKSSKFANEEAGG
jgi:uncharacterized protein YbbC (DUF1343 family)